MVEFSLEDDGVWIMADGNEYAVERNISTFLGLLIAQADALDRGHRERKSLLRRKE